MTFPCILKPYKSHVGRGKIAGKVALVQTPERLIAEYSRLDTTDVHFLVQEAVPGPDNALYGYLAFWDADGREHSWVTKRKLRQNSRFGDGSLQVTVESPEVRDQSRRLLRAFGYTGFVGVEFKFDARDRTYRLMEINPRTVSGNQLPITAGVDFPWIGYRYLTASSPPPSETFTRGVKYLNEEWDLKGFFSLRKTGDLTIWQWLSSLRGVKALAIWAWDDPLPMAIVLWRLLLAGIHRLRSVLKAGRERATSMAASGDRPAVGT
jgi:predicted ATP-grasp superfamily ATP-dependent carboligase